MFSRYILFVIISIILQDSQAQVSFGSANEYKFPDTKGKRIAVQTISFPHEKTRLKVLRPSAEIRRVDNHTDLQTLTLTPNLARPHTVARVISSAGFSGSKSDTPVGLLISNRKAFSNVDVSPPRGSEPSCATAKAARFDLSGILCVSSKTGNWGIFPVEKYEPQQCSEAIQAGPMLVEEDSTVGICSPTNTETGEAIRMAVCIDKAETLHIAYSSPTTLFDFATWLAAGELKCRVALNLTGGAQAGWVRLASVSKPLPKATGNTRSSLASMLLFEPK